MGEAHLGFKFPTRFATRAKPPCYSVFLHKDLCSLCLRYRLSTVNLSGTQGLTGEP